MQVDAQQYALFDLQNSNQSSKQLTLETPNYGNNQVVFTNVEFKEVIIPAKHQQSHEDNSFGDSFGLKNDQDDDVFYRN